MLCGVQRYGSVYYLFVLWAAGDAERRRLRVGGNGGNENVDFKNSCEAHDCFVSGYVCFNSNIISELL